MNELTREEREELVMIGKQLGTLTKADAKFILDETNNESAVNRRMITCRHRKMQEEYENPVYPKRKSLVSQIIQLC